MPVCSSLMVVVVRLPDDDDDAIVSSSHLQVCSILTAETARKIR